MSKTKTKVVNQTGRNIILKEGTANVFSVLCHKLENGKPYTIKVDSNATYREYWCAVNHDDDNHVVLSSDDCIEYSEVRIRLKPDNTYTWDALKRVSHEFVKDAGDKEAAFKRQQAQPQTQVPGGTVGMSNSKGPGIAIKAWNKIKGLFS